MTIRLQPQDMATETERRHYEEAIAALVRLGWLKLLIHCDDGTCLLTDDYLPEEPHP